MSEAGNINVVYYALFREQAGCGEETIPLTVESADALYTQLQERHGFALPPSQLRVAVNDEFVPWDSPLKSGDLVVFIPPVAGG